MTQNYGLGRGLSSLIPQKRKPTDDSGSSEKISEPKENFNYFGGSPTTKDTFVGSPAPKNTSVVPKITDLKEGISPLVIPNPKDIQEIDISLVIPNPHQPRISFDENKLQELANSIKEHGIIQPITVTKNGNQYEIIAGERRFQAAKLAGLKKIPAIIREASEQNKLELSIIENIQRHDLNPIEEAKSYKKLMEEFDVSQEEAAIKLGKSRSAVANKIRLLNLPVEIQRSLIEGKITEGHCKLLLAIPNPEKQRAFYELIIKNNLTVRQTENKTKEVVVRTHKRSVTVDPKIKQIEDELSEVLGTKVKLTKSGGGGRIVIEYYSQEELDNILGKIK